MNNSFRAWMLPEGIVEFLPTEAEKINRLSQLAWSTFASWGYQPLRPPVVEYAETFLADDHNGDLSEQTIQFKDHKSGKQLGFRADITPQIARIDAHYLKTENVSRYAYVGEVVRSYPTGHNASRNPTVVGAELLGSESQQADTEIVSLLIDFLKNIPIPKLTIELGNVDIITELLSSEEIDNSQFSLFFVAFANKDKEQLMSLCKANYVSSDNTQLFLSITEMYGDKDALEKTLSLFVQYPTVNREISRLASMMDSLSQQYPQVNFHFDLSDVYGYGYHNGIIFSAYVHGVWEAIARGGRYDAFGNQFNEHDSIRPSIGFSCDLGLLIPLLDTPINKNRVIKYDASLLGSHPETGTLINKLRENGDIVIACFDDTTQPNQHCSHAIALRNQKLIVIENQ